MSRIFSGEHDHKLDYKGRLVIPDDFVAPLGEVWNRAVIMKQSSELPLPDGKSPNFLCLYDVDTWKSYLDWAYRKMDPDETRLFMHEVVGDGATVDVDASKRITLPGRFLEYANIEKQSVVKMVGAIDRIELWNPDIHTAHVESLKEEGVNSLTLADLARSRIHEVS